MGLTYAQSFLRARVCAPTQLTVLTRSAHSQRRAAEQCDAQVATSPDECLPEAQLLVLAVKPQDAPALFEQLRPSVTPRQLVLSVMAGITLEQLRRGLGIDKVVRAMPNLPAKVGAGMTVYTSAAAVTREEDAAVHNLLATTGACLYVAREALLDGATAVSGSGPAYVFYFMEAMTQQARALGFSESESELLVLQTFSGAVELLRANELGCRAWIDRVSSRGGTTEAAVRAFGEAEVAEGIAAGIRAACRRAEELGG